LYPPAWITDRVAITDDQVENISIAKDVTVVAYIYGIHHNEKYWPEPKKFDPSRFEKDKVKKRHPYAFLPFGGGPRLCIGNNFAIMEMQLILIRMIQRYEFEMVSSKEIQLLPMITLRSKNPIHLRLRPVSKLVGKKS